MPTDPNMTGLVYPDEDSSSDIWDTILNSTVFPVIGAHTHTTGDGVPIVSAALRINADVPWSSSGSNYSITDLKAAAFTPKAASAVSALTSALFVDSSTNDLYFRNASGTNVQLTDGNSINVSLIGGISGDYSSVGALLSYDDATDTYLAKQEESASVRQYGKMAHADLKLFEYLAAGNPTAPTNAITIKSPAGLAAAYAITFPAAVPVEQTAVQVSTSGQLIFSNTFTAAPVAPNYFYTEEQPLTLPASTAIDVQGSHTKFISGTLHAGWTLAASVNPIQWNIPIRAGEWIGTWTVYLDKNTNGSAQLEAQVYKINGTTGVVTGIGDGDTDTQNAPNFITLSETIDEIAEEGCSYVLAVTPSGSVTSAADVLYHATVGIYRISP